MREGRKLGHLKSRGIVFMHQVQVECSGDAVNVSDLICMIDVACSAPILAQIRAVVQSSYIAMERSTYLLY